MNRRNHLKKPFCIFLLMLLLFSLGSSVYALSGIDLSRVKFNTGSKVVELRFGTICIEGEASQIKPFTEAEVNKLAQKVLTDMGKTQLDIIEANRMVEKAHRAASFTQEDIDRIKANLLTSMNTVPAAGNVATMLSYIDKYMSTKSWDDIGTVSVDMGEESMNEKVKDTAKGFISDTGDLGEDLVEKTEWIGNLANIGQFCIMIEEEQAHDKQKWEDIANGANAKRLLNEFYDKLQDKIAAYKYDSDEKGWTINFGEAMDGRNFSFFGVGNNYQNWTVDMTLKQERHDSLGSIAGDYRGIYSVTASHDMSGFTSEIDRAAKNMDPVKEMLKAYDKVKEIKPYLSKSSNGKASIERIIMGDCTATIEKDGTIRFYMKDKNDDTTVSFSNIGFDLNLVYTDKNLGSVLNFAFPIKIGNDKQSVTLQMSSLGISDLSPDINVSKKYLGNGKAVNVGWDKAIWEPWDNNEKKLVLK